MHDHQSLEGSLQAADAFLVTCILEVGNGRRLASKSIAKGRILQVHCRAQWTGVPSSFACSVDAGQASDKDRIIRMQLGGWYAGGRYQGPLNSSTTCSTASASNSCSQCLEVLLGAGVVPASH